MVTYRTVIKTELFPVGNVLVCEHADGVRVITDLVNCLAVGAAAVAQTTRVVAIENGIDSQYIVAIRVIHVPFEGNIVEIW